MNKSELLHAISTTLVKAKAERLAALTANKEVSVSDLLELTFYNQPDIAFRAAWILECVVRKYPERFESLIPEFLDRYIEQNNQSCQRHFTKIITCITDPKWSAMQHLVPHYNVEPIIEKTFEWLIDEKAPVALQVNCMDVLFNLRNRSSWIGEELRSQILFLLHDGSPAVQSRGKAILKKLK
ncbi:hypothetical protein GZH53_08455 [Flavihumibacter sp. R14]|nr:hypothetical protein [Flavihumibacter soli]